MSLDRLFDFKEAQKRWNDVWDKQAVFTPEQPSDKEAFVITLPPPNVTGILHVGHVLGDTVQDMLVRWKRMQGYNALYVPGTDHAGIATQKVVENHLREQGIERRDLSREQFLEHAWTWKDKHHKHIVEQLRNLGVSLDWTREAFTLDDERSEAVRLVFVKLYEKGLIYRGDYIVNWCPSCETAISDEEVEYIEKDSHLYWIRYPVEGGGDVTVATTRPETMLGDTAVAVSPQDADKQKLVGKTAVLPLVGRKIPIIADDAVDPEFGSGFVKVTPAHDPNDFDMGVRHDLPRVVVIDRSGAMTAEAGEPYAGLDRFKARKKVLAALEEQGLLAKVEPYKHSVGQHDRCHTVIEPLLSREWFVKMEPLAKPAIDVVENGDVDFYPPHWRNVYMSWMTNIRDWCVSRRLWWGHRIPVWYCPDGHLTVAGEDPVACAECGSTELTQDENVLDTWFSSWLWTFTPLGWPKETADLKQFHPTSVLVTAPEIIFFWVARMIMASLEFLGEIPFKHVFLTGIVRDGKGRKMSKSLGNSPDPLDIIDNFGTDAFRFTLMMLSPPGRDVFFSEDKLEMGRNFMNKVWQASRMVLGALERETVDLFAHGGGSKSPFIQAWNDRYDKKLSFEPDLQWEDRWILSALAACAKETNEKLDGWRLNEGASRIYDFFWNDYCDWYLELAKIRLNGDGDKRTVLSVLLFVLAESQRLLHPITPYITEELWSNLPMTGGVLLDNRYPGVDNTASLSDEGADAHMHLFRDLVTATRNIRAEFGIKPGTKITLFVRAPQSDSDALATMEAGIRSLARVEHLAYGPDVSKEKGSASTPIGKREVIVPLEGVADIAGEVERLSKEKEKLQGELAGVDKKLSNASFVEKAKPEVVAKAREKKQTIETELAKIVESLGIIGGE